jgi:hypothetical protein
VLQWVIEDGGRQLVGKVGRMLLGEVSAVLFVRVGDPFGAFYVPLLAFLCSDP